MRAHSPRLRVFFETLLQDLRYAARGLAHNPVFTATAIFAAALGISSSTAVFSVVDRILFRSLPYPHDEQLVSVGVMAPLDTTEFMLADGYFILRRNQAPFQSMTSVVAGVVDCDLADINAARPNPVRLGCAQVEGNFLTMLGRPPLLGRGFTAEEDKPNGPQAALITSALWRGRFGADPAVIGRVIRLDGKPVNIVGVLPADFEMPTLSTPDLLLPSQMNEATERAGRAFRVFARLRPGVTMEQARQALAPVFRRIVQETVPAPFRKEVTLRIRSLRDRQVQDMRRASWILLAAVGSVLLIACANIANLLLARSMARQREMAVRAALGARRGRLIRQTLTESLLLGVIGGAFGCLGASVLLRLFTTIAPSGILRLQQATLDGRVLLFATAGSLTSALLFGLAPALRLPRAELLAGWRAVGVPRTGLREYLVAAQIAVTLVLLTGAGMLLRSLWRLESASLGLETEHVVAAEFTLSAQRYATNAQQLQFFNALDDRLAFIPGATNAAITDSLPPYGGTRGRLLASIRVEGQPPFAEGTGGLIMWRYVSAGYFKALGIPVVQGRAFRNDDSSGSEQRVILSQSLAHRLFPNGDAVGRRIHLDDWAMVVGIAGDVRDTGPGKPPNAEYYLLRMRQPDAALRNQMAGSSGWRHAFLVVRTPVNARIVTDSIKRELAALDPELPIAFTTMEQRVGKLAQAPRFNAVLLSLFAGMGLLLAIIGLYGVLSFLVVQRTPEIGIRMALGATSGDVARMVLARAARWVLGGASAGIIGSLFATSLLRAMLFESSGRDPAIYAAVLATLLVTALAAASIPLRRAIRVQPMSALRHE